MGVTREEVQLKHRDCQVPAWFRKRPQYRGQRVDKTKSGGWEGAGLEGRLESEGQERDGHWGESQHPPLQLTGEQ